jgi:hypothetical protein
MPRWEHPKKEVREALGDADAADGFEIEDTSDRGHGWGCVRCKRCGQRFSVWTTPKSTSTHAKQILQFMRRHERRHHDEDEATRQ